MFKLTVTNTFTGEQWTVTPDGEKITMGRGEDCHIPLPSPFISRHQGTFHFTKSGCHFESLGANAVFFDNERLPIGKKAPLTGGSEIRIAEFSIVLGAEKTAASAKTVSSNAMYALISRLHSRLLREISVDYLTQELLNRPEYFERFEEAAEKIFSEELSGVGEELEGFVVAESLKQELCMLLVGGKTAGDALPGRGRGSFLADFEIEIEGILAGIQKTLSLARAETISERMNIVEGEFDNAYKTVRELVHPQLSYYVFRRFCKKQVQDIIFGFGPLEDLLRMPNITEIMVVNKDLIYIERNGRLEKSGRHFISDEVSTAIIERIVGPLGRRIDRSQPLVDARLPDGSRVNAIIPPLAVKGPCITIRKFPERQLTPEDMVQKNTLTLQAVQFLQAAVSCRKNVLISGGTGSGKTTLLNVLSTFIPAHERIVTIEDSAELKLFQEHVVSLEAKPANAEGKGGYSIRDLVKNALRMRPDRIIVGECRGAEALDMLQAMNTGHQGSMTTIHANTPEDVVHRLEVLVLQAADMPLKAIREQIVSALDLIVHQVRLSSGRRVITSIQEVLYLDDESGEVVTQDIFRYREGKTDEAGRLCLTGVLPSFMMELMQKSGVEVFDQFFVNT